MILVYNKNLEIVGVATEYISAIFSVKYYDIGECELYVIANEQNFALYQKGYYIVRSGSETAYIIKYLEINTDSENGNFLVVKGYDAKSFLSQRVLLTSMDATGSSSTSIRTAEEMIRTAVDECLGSAVPQAKADRAITDSNNNLIFGLGSAMGLADTYAFPSSLMMNLGTIVQEACQGLRWGYRVRFAEEQGSAIRFWFELYQGTDRSDSVEFSPRFDNLKSSQFIDSTLNFANVAICLPSGGKDNDICELGNSKSVERCEMPSKSSFATTMTGNEIAALKLGSGSSITIYSGGQPFLCVYNYKYLAWDSARLDAAVAYKARYGGTITPDPSTVTTFPTMLNISTVRCGFINSPSEYSSANYNSTFYCIDFFLNDMMQREAMPILNEKADTTTFTASIVPEVSFKLNQDYFLGDIIKVTDGAGHSAKARIVEIMEADDENGYSIEPTLEIVED